MITAIDSNVIFDVLIDDLEFAFSSQESIQRQSREGRLIISPIVHGEILVYFLKKHEKNTAITKLGEFLRDLDIQVQHFSEQDFMDAAEAWGKYNPRIGVQCPRCGAINIFSCNKCKRKVFWRNHLLTDFLIGAHAQNNADYFLTRDRGYYQKYFKVKII